MNYIKKSILITVMLVIGFAFAQETTQQLTVTGIVKDETNEPLIGASITIKNQPGLGTTTDMNGAFSIKANAYDILVFTYIGYDNKEVPVQGKSKLGNIVMQEASKKIEEVVIVSGNRVQRKITQTGAITTINPETLKGVASANVSNALAGNVPGIIAMQTTGEPGKNVSEFWIRGISTFGANASALVLVDGIERNLDEINVEDIESFSVLKDASATAVYGQRGANGVILVSTKKGKEGKVNINFKGEYGVLAHTNMPEFVDGVTYARLVNEAKFSRNQDPLYTDEEIDVIQYGLDPDLYPNVNWRDYAMRKTSPSYKASLNISGGGSTARYYISGSYYNEQGMYKTRDYNSYNTNVDYKRYNYRANVDVNITKSTIVELGIGGWIALNNGPTSDSDAIWNSLGALAPVRVPIMYSNGMVPTYGDGFQMNPDAVINRVGYRQGTESKMETNVTLKQELGFITKGLSFTGRFAFDTYNNQVIKRSKSPNMYYAEPQRNSNGDLVMRRVRSSSPLSQSSDNNGNRRYYTEASLNYERLFGNDHRVSGLLLYYQEEIANANDVGTNIKMGIPKRNMALSGRVTYGYKDRYLVEGNFGYTGSENFQKKNRFGFFPAVALGWVLSEEPWIKKRTSSWLEVFKIRASYGEVGNDRISNNDADRFPFISTIISDNEKGFSFGESGSNHIGGYVIEKLGASRLTWETAVKWDLGIDLSLWDGLFTLTADIFKDHRKNIFMERGQIPFTVGVEHLKPWANIGEMESKGIDGNFAIHKKVGEVDITLRGNLTYAINEVLDSDEAANALTYQMRKGYRHNQMKGLIAEGLFESQEEIDNRPKQDFGSICKPGDIKYKDVNGDGIINKDDIVPLGYTDTPNLTYGFGGNATWKNIDFNILFQGSGKSSFMLEGWTRPFSGGETGNILTYVANPNNRWISREYSGSADTERADAIFPRLTYGDNANNNQSSTYWLRSSRYLRLKTLEIGYTLPGIITRKCFIERARFFFLGNNLAVFSPFKWWDAEAGRGDGMGYPINKTYTVGVQLSF
ncbi:TonB-dependent receptor [Bacteroides sp.]|uniref:SusC/RagA family TonB-linked outer membrane protein n=1 Tax=Bacteroides sp. TaxID=29523 RepID=UPI002621339F|nr:TonB-dependent receptor [Bacteroides sp.]MDD3036985.1 TonB-dependent receptor [Bacteroides sp.]